jgi:hypothetical protein
MPSSNFKYTKKSNISVDGQQYLGSDLDSYISDKVKSELEPLQKQLKQKTESTIKNVSDDTSFSVIKLQENIDGFSNSVKKGLDKIPQALEDLDQKGTEIMNSMGATRARLGEFKAVYAEALPAFTEMGLGDPTETIKEIGTALGGASSIGVEAIRELGATSQVVTKDAGTLAKNFRDVGVSIYDVGDTMKEVVDYTRSVGGNVKDVSDKVVTNLEQLNMFNFSSGVGGLAKMAAQASRLGIDMGTVFETSEKLLNPENAIEMASKLQAMGVANSEMLDPLRLMDMGLNGPDELMKSMKDVSKEFVQLNEKGQFEIMPGAKRRMREVADAMGMGAEEFSKMALKSADFDRKLKEIKMPDFVGSDETKEMIATMAQMKDGKAVITVKDEETGKAVEKEVDQLTPEDIDNLKLSQEEKAKTMEEIAIDQLDTQKRIATAQEAVANRIAYGGAASAPMQRAYNLAAGVQRQGATQLLKKGGPVDYDFMLDKFNKTTGSLEQMAIAIAKGDFEGGALGFQNLVTEVGNFETELTDSLNNVINGIKTGTKDLVKDIYGDITGVQNTTVQNTTVQNVNTTTGTKNTGSQNVNTATGTQNLQEIITKSDINVNVKLSSDANVSSTFDQKSVNDAITKYFSDYSNLQKIFNIDVNTGLIKTK